MITNLIKSIILVIMESHVDILANREDQEYIANVLLRGPIDLVLTPGCLT